VKYKSLFESKKSFRATPFIDTLRAQNLHAFIAYRAELLEHVSFQQFYSAELETEVAWRRLVLSYQDS
jgi:hypothetical protein